MNAEALGVIVPSRGRPSNIADLITAWSDTYAAADVIVGVDDDDPQLSDYRDVVATHPRFDLAVGPRLRMGGTLNEIATAVADRYAFLGFLGDDHRPRTAGWDRYVCDALTHLGTGLTYGNDLLQGETLPTAVFLTSDIVRTLGWMAPPGLIHLFLDNSWLTLGRALDAITYLPDVVIEHCHPIAGKAASDAGYDECNAPDVWEHDERIYRQWLVDGLARDVETIRVVARSRV